MANCLQFTKEVGMNPALMGTNKTRAMVCELLAMRLLKEFTTRELIDALAYDFHPLQGQDVSTPAGPLDAGRKQSRAAARTSCLEVAIRASAKRFLAHPLVVRQLEAIWAGSIVFHSAADSLHRLPIKVVPNQHQGYGTIPQNNRLPNPATKLNPAKQRDHLPPVEVTVRRSVTLYDPRDASLFKLSRLRVPRYRNILSTLSFAVLLGLFLAVLLERSLEITPLEVVFWLWSAGYMLDEVVGFNEQGFSLYLASFWNTFDLGILLILIAHLCLRLYGILMPSARKHSVANTAYDILAADAVLLFPRLFSVLDHYRYFSQLLIAFRMMATDLMAIFILILISCSGFFVALTLSFGNDQDTPSSIAYAIFQMLMGFSPAAWQRWDDYNILGRTILVLFLFITHFLVVTILITVLTNSFMAIVQNANDEHQFLFAVNTISMVKSDSLFSYVAPTNIIGWVLTPLRYALPFRRYVKLNRTVIKVTHFPVLFAIFAYEKTFLRSAVFESTDLVETRGRPIQPKKQVGTGQIFSPRPSRMVREPSIATYQKDRALEEVFRQPFKDSVRTVQPSQERRKTSNVVNTWMNNLGDSGLLSPPQEQDRSTLDRLERRRGTIKFQPSQTLRPHRDFTDRSVASNPEDYFSNIDLLVPPRPSQIEVEITPSALDDDVQQTDAGGDGDDEMVTNDNDEDDKMTTNVQRPTAEGAGTDVLSSTVRRVDYFTQHPTARPKTPVVLASQSPKARTPRFLPPTAAAHDRPSSRRQSPTRVAARRPHHSRNVSTATMLYNPVSESNDEKQGSPGISPRRVEPSARQSTSAQGSGGVRSGTRTPVLASTPAGDNRRTTKKAVPRPSMPSSKNPAFRSVPNLAGLVALDTRQPGGTRPHKVSSFDIGSDIGDNKAIGGGWLAQPGGYAASYTTNTWMLNAGPARRDTTTMGRDGRQYTGRRHSADEEEDSSASNSGDKQASVLGRIMLARMNNLEEGFREVVSEMRDHLRREENSETSSRQLQSEPAQGRQKPTRGQSTKTVKGKEKERELPQQRPLSRRKKSSHRTSVVRSKGNSDAGAERAENEWVDMEEDRAQGAKGGTSSV